jgi:uncharacterized protein (DUF58 family)
MRLRVGRASGARPGETPVRGASQSSGVEVESFKTYTPGDDIRHVDWIALGRLDQLFTRRFVPEREIPLHVLVDGSASMGVPRASSKFRFAIRLAVSLAYMAINHNDSVRLAVFRRVGEELALVETRRYRHRGRFPELEPILAGLAPSGGTALLEGVNAYLERNREGGLAFVLSDFLTPVAVYQEALTRLRARRLEVRVVHLVGHAERELGALRGRLRLRDVETGTNKDVALTETERRRYRQAFESRIEEIRRFCHAYGIGHALAVTEDGVAHFLTRTLAAQGLIEFR